MFLSGDGLKMVPVGSQKVPVGRQKVPVGRQTSSMSAGKDNIGGPEVKILSPLRDIVASSFMCVREGQYDMNYAPEVSGNHQLELMMAEYDASCGVVTDVKAANVNLGDGLEKVPVGRKTSSMIAGQGDMGDTEVEILSPPKEKVKSSIRCVKKGQYEVDYAPEGVGDHQVEVKMAGLHVQDFSIDASQAVAGNLEFECQIIDTQQQLSDWLELRSSDNVQNLCRLVRLVGGHGVGLELQTSTLPVMTSFPRLAVVTGV